MSEYDTKAESAGSSGGAGRLEGAGLYEEHLERQAQALRRLKVQRGDPSLRRIQARARELFGDGVPLPLATQHAAFNGRYVSLDKLIILVRTLMSWDPYGQSCPPPDRTHPVLAPWHEQWRVIAELRPRRHRPAPARTPASASASGGPEPAVDSEGAGSRGASPEPAAAPSGRFAARVFARAGRALTATSLAGVLVLALDASSPRLCTTAYVGGGTPYALPAADRQADHPARAAGGAAATASASAGLLRRRRRMPPGLSRAHAHLRLPTCHHSPGRAGFLPRPGPQPQPTLEFQPGPESQREPRAETGAHP